MLWPNTAAGYREAAHRWNVREEAATVKNDDGRYRQELCPPPPAGGCNHHHRALSCRLFF